MSKDGVVDELRCPLCGRIMLIYVGTPLCPCCDWDTIYDLRWEHDVLLGREVNK